MKHTIKILLAMALVLTSCAPKAEDRKFPEAKTTFGPRSKDTDLSSGLKPSDKINASLAWTGPVSTARYFEQAENLIALGELTGKADLSEKGLSWIRNFYQTSGTTQLMDLSLAPFTVLATAHTQTEVQDSLDEILGELAQARGLIHAHILGMAPQIPPVSEGGTLFEVVMIARKFTASLITSLDHLDILPAIRDSLKEELLAQTNPLFDQVVPFASKFYSLKNLSDSLRLINEALTLFKVELDPVTAASLRDGRLIASDLDVMNDAQGALTVLIDVWRTLAPQDRILYFKAANETLFDFLVKQDESDLACLRTPGCNGGFFQGIKKKVFILPKIDDYGVRRLHDEMNKKSLAYVVSRVEGFAKDFVKGMATTFASKIDDGIVAKAEQLGGARQDYPECLKKLMARWAKKTLAPTQGQIPGFEVSNLTVNISDKSAPTLQALGNMLDLDANTASSSMMANVLLMEKSPVQDDLTFRSALSQLNKLISIGGYREPQPQARLIPALLAPLEQGAKFLDIMNLMATASSTSYRIPDRIKLSDSLHADEKMIYEKNFSASSFANQIEGLSHLLQMTADWKPSSFDKILGGIKAQDLTHEVKTPALDRPLFPKDMFFALNVGAAAVLLQDITKKATPVFLLTLQKKIVWADRYDSALDNQTAVMAGLVDIKNGKRSNVVQSRDVAKFLLALGEFLKATEGVENTKSTLLHEKDATGKTPLDSLMEGRKDLKLLIVALANFISNQLINENHLIQGSYYLPEMLRSNNPEYLIEEQMLGIRSLLKAYQITGISNYLFAAQEIYFAVNKKFFDPDEQFYVNADGSKLDLPQKTVVLVALQELKSTLPVQSQGQLERVSAPWLRALQALK